MAGKLRPLYFIVALILALSLVLVAVPTGVEGTDNPDDTTNPVLASVTAPVDNAFYSAASPPPFPFTGQAADNDGGVGLFANSTRITLQRASDGAYWDGGFDADTWRIGPPWWLLTIHAGTNDGTTVDWQTNFFAPPWLEDVYTVQARATDRSENEFTGTAITFIVDNTIPTVTITNIPDQVQYLNEITGTANDPAPGQLQKVQLTIRRLNTNKYWDGDSWEDAQTWLDATGTANWTYDSSGIPLSAGSNYRVTAKATDMANNESETPTDDFLKVNPPAGFPPVIKPKMLKVLPYDEPPVFAPVDLNGRTLTPLTITHDNVTINIPAGTTILDSNGNPPNTLWIETVPNPPPPPPGNIIALPIDFGPNGVTFSPPIEISFTIDPSTLPPGADPANQTIAYFDVDTGQWIELATTYDPATGTYTALVDHFTTFSVLVKLPPPAEFTISDLTIIPAEVNTEETVTISAVITNTGGASGTYEATLKIDDLVLDSKSIILEGSQSQEITFTTTGDEAGTYQVNVNDLSGQFVVKETPPPPVEPTAVPPEQNTTNWWLIAGVIAAVAVAGLLGYRRRTKKQ